jgi:hypothetical protein
VERGLRKVGPLDSYVSLVQTLHDDAFGTRIINVEHDGFANCQHLINVFRFVFAQQQIYGSMKRKTPRSSWEARGGKE